MPREVDLLVLVLLFGALGSFVHVAKSFASFAGNRALVASWVWWYLLQPVAGMALALLFAAGGPISGFEPSFSWWGQGKIGPVPVPVIIFLTAVVVSVLFFIIRYRERPGHQAYYTHGKGKIEIGITTPSSAARSSIRRSMA